MTDLYWDEDDGQEGLLTRRSSEFCLSEQEVEDYLFNRLSGVTREAVEEHLLLCESCRLRVEEEERILDAARTATEKLETESLLREFDDHAAGGPPPGRSRRPLYWMATAAAAAIVLIGGSLTYRMLHAGPALEVSLHAERGGVERAQEPVAGQKLVLSADLRGLPPLSHLRWSVVDSLGVPVAGGTLEVHGESGRIELARGLPAGMYWVRLLDPDSGVLLREFGLVVKARGR